MSIEEMAANYVQEIRSCQPRGPYYLGGYCMGGGVAFEVAQQLRSQGETVPFLALLETYNVSALPRLSAFSQFTHGVQRIKFQLDNVLLAGSMEGFKFLAQKARTERARFKAAIRSWGLALGIGRTATGLYPHLRVAKINDIAFGRYFPRRYEGQVTLFRPRNHFAGLSDPQFAWGSLVKTLSVVILPVSPRGMLAEPFVRLLGAEMKMLLEHAQFMESPRVSREAQQ